jgi:alpha-L-rhamnosidase
MSSIAPFINLRTSGLGYQLLADSVPELSWEFATGGEAPDRAVVEVYQAGASVPMWQGTWRVGTQPAVRYAGPPLERSAAYTWRVGATVRDTQVWSAAASFETHPGPLHELAEWIGLQVTEPADAPTPVQYLRRTFHLEAAPVRARLYASARGWYGLAVNGGDVTGVRITPRFTAYDQRLEYEGYDVTDELVAGSNTLGIELAEGRYRGRNGAFGQRNTYGQQIAAIAYLLIEFESGRREIITTDAAWEGGYGPRRFADPQEGVTIDARISAAQFTAGTALADARPVEVFPRGAERVEAARSEPVVVADVLEPARTTTIGDRIVVDFGQNLVGVARLTVAGPAGTTLAVHHSELVDETGRIRTDYLLGDGVLPAVPAIDRYVLAGGGSEIFEPRYTIRGFRYIEIEGAVQVDLERIEALVLQADLRYDGEFSSSHSGLNRLHDNIVWSMRGNFTDVPTDCPTRERSGWTGDAQVFAPAATYLADVSLFLRDWLRDVVLQQGEDGALGDVAPRDSRPLPELSQFAGLMDGKGSAGWADAITMVPWTLYQRYGCTDVLAENWDAMVAWVQFCLRRAADRHPSRTGDPSPHERYVVDTGFHWGEWLEPGNEFDGPEAVQMILNLANNPDAEVATAYFAHSARLVAEAAAVLGKAQSALEYSELHERIRAAYQAEFLDPDGMPRTLTQAKLVRPLTFGLIPEHARQRVADRLADLVVADGTRLATGFLSTGYLLPALSAWGYDDLALDLLLQEEQPSWLGQVAQGATTILESWNGTGSQNHYALGAVARWMYENLAGLRAVAPGWQQIEIRPMLTHRLEHVSARTMTPYGLLSSAWQRSETGWEVEVTVPAGVEARIAVHGANVLEDGARIAALPCGTSAWRVRSARVDTL